MTTLGKAGGMDIGAVASAIIDALPVAVIVVTGSDGTIGYANAVAERRFGREDAPLVGRPASSLAQDVRWEQFTPPGLLGDGIEVLVLQGDKAARQVAQAAAQRLARLQFVTGRLAEATSFDEVATTVVREGKAGVGADGAALLVLEPKTRELQLVASEGLPEGVEHFSVPLDGDYPATMAIRAGQPLAVDMTKGGEEQFPILGHLAGGTCQAEVVLPLHLEGQPVGGVLFGWLHDHDLDKGEHDFLLALARQAVIALERARLYEAERSARAAAEEARERMTFLAEASRVLASSLDYRETLARLTSLAVPEIADACSVHLVVDDDVQLVAVAHVDPKRRRVMAELASRPTHENGPILLGRVAVTGEPLVFSELPDTVWQAIAEDEDHLAALRSLGLTSGVVVPMSASDTVLGVLSLGSCAGGHQYSTDDLPFVCDLAGRAAVAIENSRAHLARSEVARTLQRSLLPPHLPRIPGLELASRYHAAGELDVGGDFYDVFPAGDGRWGVVMGDVCGKGVHAATLTALARYSLRAVAIDEAQPAHVLGMLNRTILEAETGERFCTITHAVVTPGDGSARVTLACAGHPLPLLVSADGTVREVGEPGMAVGLFDDADFAVTEVDVTLSPGEALVFYTDGFVEVRSPDGRFAPGLLRSALAAAGGGVSAHGLADAVDRAVLAFEGGEPRDDMALLILRVPS